MALVALVEASDWDTMCYVERVRRFGETWDWVYHYIDFCVRTDDHVCLGCDHKMRAGMSREKDPVGLYAGLSLLGLEATTLHLLTDRIHHTPSRPSHSGSFESLIKPHIKTMEKCVMLY